MDSDSDESTVEGKMFVATRVDDTPRWYVARRIQRSSVRRWLRFITPYVLPPHFYFFTHSF